MHATITNTFGIYIYTCNKICFRGAFGLAKIHCMYVIYNSVSSAFLPFSLSSVNLLHTIICDIHTQSPSCLD